MLWKLPQRGQDSEMVEWEAWQIFFPKSNKKLDIWKKNPNYENQPKVYN